MEKRGLGLPDPKLYYLSFEMTKLVEYWRWADGGQNWLVIEAELCHPFKSNDGLSQKISNNNPVIAHSREVWTKDFG